MSKLIPSTTPLRKFEGHKDCVNVVAVFPDRRRMVTGSSDKTVNLWDLKTGVVLKKMEWHSSGVEALAVSRDGQTIASGDENGVVIVWHGETGESLTQPIKAHSSDISSLDFSADGTVLATSSWEETVKLWCTKTWQQQGKIQLDDWVKRVLYSPSGELLAIATVRGNIIEIYDSDKRECIATLETYNDSLAWTPDGTRLLSAGGYRKSRRRRIVRIPGYSRGDPNSDGDSDSDSDSDSDGDSYSGDGSDSDGDSDEGDDSPSNHSDSGGDPPSNHSDSGGDPPSNHSDITIQQWDTSTWEKVGDPWKSDAYSINAIAINPAGTLVAFVYDNSTIHLWQLSDQRTIAIFRHSESFTGGPNCVTFSVDGKHILCGGDDNKISEWEVCKGFHSNILATLTAAARNSCTSGDLSTAEQLLTQEIDTDSNNYTSYANRSFVMARKQDWDHALEDAVKSISIEPSLMGYISKAIALCGKGQLRDVRVAFDVASMFTNRDSTIIHFLLLIKAIVLFNVDQHDEAMLLIKELAAACPNSDLLVCHVVEAYLRVQLGTKALDDARYDDAADHFAAAVNSSAFPSKIIHELYEDLILLFGWDLESLWLTAHQKRCQAFLLAGKIEEALESHQHMMNAIDETEKASCLDWSNDFKEQCGMLVAHDDRILGAEIPGQEQNGYDAEPDFFRGMHDYPPTSQPRPPQRPGRFKKLRLTMTRTPRPVPPPAPPSTPPPTAATTVKTHLQHLFTRRSDHEAPPVVNVSFAKGKERNAAADAPAPGQDEDLVPDEYFDNLPQDSDTREQQKPVTAQGDIGEHGGGKSYFCC